jgi:hypothetical protein
MSRATRESIIIRYEFHYIFITRAIAMTENEPILSARSAEYRARRYKEWALNLICWDGPLPAAIVVVPMTVSSLFPKQEALIIITYIAVPITAFFVRAAVADRHFKEGEQYGWQQFLFICSIFFLVFVDALTIVLQDVAGPVAITEWLFLLALYLVYLPLIGLSLFPFRIAGGSEKAEKERSTETVDGWT